MAKIDCPSCGMKTKTDYGRCVFCDAEVSEPPKQAGNRTILAIFLVFIAGLSGWVVATDRLAQPEISAEQRAAHKAQLDAEVAELIKQQEAERKYDLIKGSFSAWDGSHRELERQIKATLEDPDSYEHIKTSYTDLGENLLISTKYRAKNSFGGYVITTVGATATYGGEVIDFWEE